MESIYELLDNIDYQKRLDEFQEKRKRLRDDINFRLDNHLSDNEYKLVKQISEMPDYDTKTYEEKYWLWNYGKYRTKTELEIREQEKRNAFYANSYDSKHNQFQFLCIIPVIIWLLLVGRSSEFPIGRFMNGLFTSPIMLIFVSLFSIIASNIKLKEMNKHNLPRESKYYIKEKANRDIGSVGFAASVSSLFKRSKDNLKEISNPDTWKQMK